MTLSYQERIDRILNTEHIVLIDDWSVHRVEGIYPLGSVIFIDTGVVNYQDTEVMTFEESTKSIEFYQNIKGILEINN